MTTEKKQLPYFVRKQVEMATNRLFDALPEKSFQVTVSGYRVVLQVSQPHPGKPGQIKVPLALLDFQSDGWHLFFRGANGGWQRLPEDQASRSLDAKVDAILTDPYKLFWRQ
ncbi:MAG: DUF3024 domain-containing protein [Reinekea sp.]|jgi:hypothetical protein|nr:DUF3024 domain-containing protein [Reinekea sp.]